MGLRKILARAMTALVLILPATRASAQDDSVLYVPSNQLSAFWSVKESATPKYPKGPDNRIKEACVIVAYIIEPGGSTSSEHVVVAYPSERFGESALKAIRKFRFSPADTNPKQMPVYTTTLFMFHLKRSDETNEKVQDALSKICTSAAQQVLGGNSDVAAVPGAEIDGR